jgi:RNA polymerase sigma factor (sigma-70 family)
MSDLRQGRKNGGTKSPDASDAELVHAARRGDKRAFVEIVARHQAMVCGIALAILGDFAASEDAAQEAFLTAWRKFHDLREPERLRPWLAQIARNAALGYLRRTRGHDALEEAVGLADDSPAPDEAAANEEEAALVRESLAKLPETYRLPLVLFYREGQSVRAVAEALGISEDAVKQRLARGREMLRDRMSGMIETVLTRTGPTAVFTMTIAAAIGALAAPAAIAAGVFTASATAGASTSAGVSSPILAAMSTSKTFLVTTALVAAVCVPVGYYVSTDEQRVPAANATAQADARALSNSLPTGPNFENSALFAEWRALHEKHGTNAAAMPALYKEIAEMKDAFRRRAFRAALIAEWVQVDAAGGFAFFRGRGSDTSQRKQFFEEWLAHDPNAAVTALVAGAPGWEGMAHDCLPEIARRVPSRVAEIASRLPASENYWSTGVRDAFAILAQGGLSAARTVAERVTGPNRAHALGGVAQVWGKSDLNGALAWAKGLPEGLERDEVIRSVLLGRASVDPVAALDLAGIVPPGGRHAYFATTTGARVLKEAATANFDATVSWLQAHPGRMSRDDMMGMVDAVTQRLNADPRAFLTTHLDAGSLDAILPAIENALLNRASGQRSAIWEWLNNQPDSDTTRALRKEVLTTAGFQDPELAIRLVTERPQAIENESHLESFVGNLFNGGHLLNRVDRLLEVAPDALRTAIAERSFTYLRGDTLDNPQQWIARTGLLPETSRGKAMESIARAWGEQSPEEAFTWVSSLPGGDTRNKAVGAVTTSWANRDAHSAADWVASMPAGSDRDHSAGALVFAVADKYPREAWDWAVSIQNELQRSRAAAHAAQMMASRDLATARQWIEIGPFTPEVRLQLQNDLERRGQSQASRPN